MYYLKKSKLEWKKDWTLESFNTAVRAFLETEKEMEKKMKSYFESWLVFVAKRPEVAGMTFDRVFHVRR